MSSSTKEAPKRQYSVLPDNEPEDAATYKGRPPNYQSHGKHSGRGQAALEFWKNDGRDYSRSYSHLYGVDPLDDGFVITFTEHVVTIRGRRLWQLFRDVNRNVAIYIWEATPQEDRLADKDASVVTQITIKDRFSEQR